MPLSGLFVSLIFSTLLIGNVKLPSLKRKDVLSIAKRWHYAPHGSTPKSPGYISTLA
jgi:hypothetical protein